MSLEHMRCSGDLHQSLLDFLHQDVAVEFIVGCQQESCHAGILIQYNQKGCCADLPL
jgi:hypothetical protein